MSIKYICVQPRTLYFAWQVEVMINNFISCGINADNINILVAYNQNDETSSTKNIEIWDRLVTKYINVNFLFYEDTREDFTYIPSVYFNILKQHIQTFPSLMGEPIFLHDCDTVFTRKVDFTSMLQDKAWYMSDTSGYIGSNYILSKGDEVYEGMCKVIGIDPLIPRILNSNSGGAQYIVKGSTVEYWDKVEKDSIKLYNYFCNIEHNYKPRFDGDYPIQKWTSGMWSLLWNAWLFGFEAKVDKKLDFCMATDPIYRWSEAPIYHNAGVVDNRQRMFYKGDHICNVPFINNLCECAFDSTKCSIKYVGELIKTKRVSCLL